MTRRVRDWNRPRTAVRHRRIVACRALLLGSEHARTRGVYGAFVVVRGRRAAGEKGPVKTRSRTRETGGWQAESVGAGALVPACLRTRQLRAWQGKACARRMDQLDQHHDWAVENSIQTRQATTRDALAIRSSGKDAASSIIYG